MNTALDLRPDHAVASAKPPPTPHLLEPAMPFEELRPGTFLLHRSAQLPAGMKLRSRHLLGWKAPEGLNTFGFERRLTENGWNYFFIVPSKVTTRFGFRRDRALRRAISDTLRQIHDEGFNSAEIVAIDSRKWLFLHRVRVTAHPRHVLDRPFLREPDLYARIPRVWNFSRVFQKLNRDNLQRKGI